MTDRTAQHIRQTIDIAAPRAQVWRALTDPDAFRAWFGLAIDAPFTPGTTVHGTLVGTSVDEQVAQAQAAHRGVAFALVVEQNEPGRRLAFRWHPGAVDPAIDYDAEPMTLVAFELEDIAGGTRVTVTESGFEALPPPRRTQAFDGNQQGWPVILGVLQAYTARGSET